MSSIDQANPVPFEGLDFTGAVAQATLLELLKKHPLAEILQTGRVLKEDKKRRVVIIMIDETREVFVKVHFDNRCSGRLKTVVFKSRGHRSHDKALSLIEHGLPTPGSLGYADFHVEKFPVPGDFLNLLVLKTFSTQIYGTGTNVKKNEKKSGRTTKNENNKKTTTTTGCMVHNE